MGVQVGPEPSQDGGGTWERPDSRLEQVHDPITLVGPQGLGGQVVKEGEEWELVSRQEGVDKVGKWSEAREGELAYPRDTKELPNDVQGIKGSGVRSIPFPEGFWGEGREEGVVGRVHEGVDKVCEGSEAEEVLGVEKEREWGVEGRGGQDGGYELGEFGLGELGDGCCQRVGPGCGS